MNKPIRCITIRNAKLNNDSFVAYTVELVYDDNEVVLLERRFRQFVSLHRQLKKSFKKFTGNLPSKAIFRNMNPSFVQTRIQGLQRYLDDIVADVHVCGSPPFQSFRDPARGCTDEIEDIFDSVDHERIDSLTSILDGSTVESLDLTRKDHYTTWSGCGAGIAVAAAGATAVVAPASLAAGAATVIECTSLAATTMGIVGAATGAAAGTMLSKNCPVTCAATGAIVGGSAGFIGTYFTAIGTLPAAARSMVGYFGLSPLHFAILRNRTAAARLLIERGVNLRTTCGFAGATGWTPLHLAAHLDRPAAAQLLLASPDGARQLLAEDSDGRTPFGVAAGLRTSVILVQAMAGLEGGPPPTATVAAATAAGPQSMPSTSESSTVTALIATEGYI